MDNSQQDAFTTMLQYNKEVIIKAEFGGKRLIVGCLFIMSWIFKHKYRFKGQETAIR